MGVDSKIRFWHDLRYGDHTLKVASLELLSMAHFKDASVADHL